MGKYIGPKIKIIRRLGLLPGFTKKSTEKKTTPGQHGKIRETKNKRFSLSEDYRLQLLEKQKLRFNYGITEKQLFSYFKKAKGYRGSTGSLLLILLETRLDSILYHLGFAPTIPAARQIINHGHIIINNKPINIPSFKCIKNDIITIKNKSISKILIKNNLEFQEQKLLLIRHRLKTTNSITESYHDLVPMYLERNIQLLYGKIIAPIRRKDISVRINELKVLQYYAR